MPRQLRRALRHFDFRLVQSLHQCTPAQKYFVREEYVSPRTFIAAVGADSPDKQELEPAQAVADLQKEERPSPKDHVSERLWLQKGYPSFDALHLVLEYDIERVDATRLAVRLDPDLQTLFESLQKDTVKNGDCVVIRIRDRQISVAGLWQELIGADDTGIPCRAFFGDHFKTETLSRGDASVMQSIHGSLTSTATSKDVLFCVGDF